MPSASGTVWSSTDRATQPANSSANHGHAHGFPVIRRADSRTVTHAATDTNAATNVNTTTITYPDTVT